MAGYDRQVTLLKRGLVPIVIAVFLPAVALSQTTTDVSIQKFAEGFVPPDFSYRLRVTNLGPADATGLTVTDVLPPEVVFISAIGSGWTCTTPPPNTNGTVQCTRAALPESHATDVTIHVAAAPGTPQGTLATNTATVTTTTPETTTANNSSTITTPLLVFADTTVQIADSPDPVVSGGVVTYTITAVNHGPHAAPDAVLTITGHSGATFDSMTAPAGWTCGSLPSPPPIQCTAASFPVGTAPFTLQVTVPMPSLAMALSAAIRSSAIEVNSTNQLDFETTEILPGAFLDGVKIITSGGQYTGTNVTYTIVLTNSGSAVQNDNPGDELTDVLPPTLALISASATSGTPLADVGNNQVTWNGALAAGRTVMITIVALVRPTAANTPVANSAQIRFDPEGDGTNNVADSTNVVTFTPAAMPPPAEVPTASGTALLLLVAAVSLVALTRLG